MSASASWGGVRLLAGCAAINLTLAAIGWFWQGGYVASALLDKVSRSGTLTLGSWNWNAVHVVLWALWLSGWFAFLAARFQIARLNGPNLHRLAMTVAAAGTAASLFWLGSLIDVAKHLWMIDGGRLPSAALTAGLVRWTAAPLAIGAAVAIYHFLVVLRLRVPNDGEIDLPVATNSEGALPPLSERGSAVRTLQFGAAALSLAAFGLFWQFIAFGPAETTWSLDRLFSGPAAEGWAALSFLALAHVAHVVSDALTVFDGPDGDSRLPEASGGQKSPVSETDEEPSQPTAD